MTLFMIALLPFGIMLAITRCFSYIALSDGDFSRVSSTAVFFLRLDYITLNANFNHNLQKKMVTLIPLTKREMMSSVYVHGVIAG